MDLIGSFLNLVGHECRPTGMASGVFLDFDAAPYSVCAVQADLVQVLMPSSTNFRKVVCSPLCKKSESVQFIMPSYPKNNKEN